MSIASIGSTPAAPVPVPAKTAPADSTGAVSSAPATTNTTTPPAAPAVGFAATKLAQARYLKTGIDKDAAAGDPDHDAPASKRLTVPSASQAVASAVPTVNAVSTGPSTTAAAAAGAYSTAAPKK
ncbi:MAG TPA: hypothetical protein VM689_06795 [Aliidongia sp.]|nr:hypothetical protein [Aliidongia sp.]